MTRFENHKPVRLIELFAGIGSQAKALTNLGLNFEHWRVCEFDEHAIRSYNAVHGTNFVRSDITKISAADLDIVNTNEFTYLLTYSFPCQDLSTAGKGAGMEKGSGTRSGLLWEVERLLNECTELPQALLMENVPQVHGKKNIEHFNKWIAFLESKGYSNHWCDLNAKDYGIPQSRNRCYMVSILGDYSFDFPVPIPLDYRLGDLLDEEVDARYYLSDDRCQRIANWKAQQNPLERVNGTESICPTITARGAGEYHSGMILFSPHLNETTNLRGTVLQREVCNKAVDITKPYEIIDYSVAAISKHRQRDANGNLLPISEYAKFCDGVNTHLLNLIEELDPTYWFIENPVGGLRKMDFMRDLPRYTITYCQYGERRQKPTDIWTNHPTPNFKPPCTRGANCHDAAPRGAKTGTQALKNAMEKSRIPSALCEHIVDVCESGMSYKIRSDWLDELLGGDL